MVSMEMVAIAPLRSLAFLGVWFLIYFPLWAPSITTINYRVLDFAPFAINAWSLAGRSYEARLLDGRVWATNMLLAAPLSIASSFCYFQRFDINAMIIIGALAGVSVLGILPTLHLSITAGENYNMRMTLMKMVGISIGIAGVLWLLAFLGSYRLNDLIPHLIMGGTMLIAMLESLFAFRGREERKSKGVGSPLLWLALRTIISAGVPYFWVWFLLEIVAFEIINCMQKRPTTFISLANHWSDWQCHECANSYISLMISLLIAGLSANGRGPSTKVTLPLEGREVLAMQRSLLSDLSSQRNDLCSERIWEVLGFPGLEKALTSNIQDAYFGYHTMFENTAALIAVMMLVLGSVGYVLRSLNDGKGKQGYWQPIFFFSVAVATLLYQRNPDESLGFIENRMSTVWHEEALVAIALCIAGCLHCVLVTAFRIERKNGNSTVVRENTTHERVDSQGGSIISVLLLFLSMMSIVMAVLFFLVPTSGVRYKNETQNVLPLYPAINNESWNWVTYGSFRYLDEEASRLLSEQVECSSWDCLVNQSFSNTSYCWSNVTLDDLALRAKYNYLTASRPIWDRLINLSALMYAELIAIAVIQVVTLGLTVGTIWFRVLDDVQLVGNFFVAIVLAQSLPIRMKEFRSLVGDNLVIEWNIIVLVILTLIGCALSVLQRVKNPPFMNPWANPEALSADFAQAEGISSLSQFVYNRTGKYVRGKTANVIFTRLNEFQDLRPRQESIDELDTMG